MKSRIPLVLASMLVVLALSLVPAASLGTQSASALSPCDWAQFVADVTVPDGTSFAANAPFTKTWRLKNIGFCTWTTSYALVFDSGNNMGGPASVNLPTSVAPGQTVDVSVNLTAPSSPGHYIGYWKFMNASGSRFGIGATMNKAWWVEINVGGGSSGVAYDFAANYCAANWYTLQGGLPCPGTDGDPHGFVLKVDNPKLENGTTDTGSGLITNPSNIFNGDIHGKYPAFHVQHGDRFQSTVNCAFGANSCYVTFRLDYQIGNGPIYTYWAFREKYEGLYFRPSIDLSPLAGKDVKFILTVLASGPAFGDRALWSNPAIVRKGAPPPPPGAGSKFDFGTSTSPVASGYTRVTEATAYSSGSFGWTSASGLESRDRNTLADDLKRDFNMSSSTAGTFRADIPNGFYAVTVTMGDQDYAHDNMVVKANGVTVLGDVDSALGAFAVNTFNVNVTGGNLQLEFSDAGGSDASWIVNALTIVPTAYAGSKFDFGTAGSPIASGYTQVTEATAYSSGGFGWTSTSSLESRDRVSLSDDLKRDFVMSSSAARTFRADIPNGSYAVTTTMGDNDYAHDNMVVKANGSTVLGDVDAAAGSFPANTFNVNVSGGNLQLEFSDAGGSDPTWVVNAVTIVPTSPPPPTPYGCDKAQFVADVTVPDGTVFAPGANFLKIWRLKNVGTCTWTTSYKMIFDSGDQMGGPSSVNMPMVVTPGHTVDVSVNLTAPATSGTYRGYWKFQNASGVPFGIGFGANKSWWVEIVVSGAPPPPPPPPPPAASPVKFDFGTASSPLATGYKRVSEATAYSSGAFGWTDTTTLESRDRGAPADDLKRDLVTSGTAARTFKVDLPNGSYSVTVTMGDNDYAHDDMVVKANGATVLPDVDNAAGAFTVNTFPVIVSTGALELEFSDAGGLDPSWVVNAVTIGNKFDFGTNSSPLAAGYTMVDETTAFSAAQGYGWTDTTTLESRDRLAPADDLKRDFVMSSSAARIFKVALLNGSYSVTVTMGDNDYAHDNMVVKANGATVLGDVDSAAGAFAQNTFNVTVSGGALQLEFSDAGGSDSTWVVNGVTINP